VSRESPVLQDYLKLFALYEGKLDFSGGGLGGGDYLFIFEQVIRLLLKPSAFNNTLPESFISTAERYAFGEAAVTTHFRSNENRQFFLSDLYDSLLLYHDGHNPVAGQGEPSPF